MSDQLYEDERDNRRHRPAEFVDPITGEHFTSKSEFEATMRDHKRAGEVDDFDGDQAWLSGHRVKL